VGIVQIRRVKSKIQVKTVYSEAWRTRAREIGGKWRARSGVWSFHAVLAEDIYQTLVSIYGKEYVPTEGWGYVVAK
jgi:hypothetical protein